MAVTDTLSRDDGAFDINTGTTETPIWTPIGGINSWSPSPTKNDADTTKFSNQGWQSHLPASRGIEHTISGLKQVDPSTGARDAGQAAVEALGFQMGVAGLALFRHTMTGGVVNVWEASVNVTSGGGGNDDPSAWEATLTMNGAPETTTGANVPAAVTAVAGTSGDDTESLISWTSGAGAPTLFEIRIYEDDDLVASIFTSQDGSFLVTGLDNGTPYTAQVRAQNAAGWSDLSDVSAAFTPSA